jgi:crotonobetainyl-CoA:carnitine CoA-transferase CaiB-like acyl-CoA transferase
MTLDLTQESGRNAFLDLVRVSDVIVENFSAGTMDRLGLPFPLLRRANPGIVLLSMSGFGATGPTKQYIAYGPLLEGVSGMAALFGYKDAPPTASPWVYTDYISGMYGVGLVMAALQGRLAKGRGCHIDLSQIEVTVNIVADAFLAAANNGAIPVKQENRDQFVFLQGNFPCAGDDAWVALSVRTEEEWERLCIAMGNPEWTRAPAFADALQRTANIEVLELRLSEWTAQRPPEAVVAAFRGAGLPAAQVLSVGQVIHERHAQARRAYVDNPHPIIGVQPAYASPLFVHGLSRDLLRHAPLWGQHNDYVCKEVLGMTQAEVERLVELKGLR